MEKNALMTVEISDLGENGEGIGRHDGLAVFVPGALPGETVSVRVTSLKKNYAHGRLEAILKPGAHRLEPPCPVAGTCGGCQIQSLSYEAQLQWKTDHVRACLARIAKLPEVPVAKTAGMETPWHYRNKAVYPAGGTAEAPVLGFNRLGSHQVVGAEGCLIQHGTNGRILKTLQELMVLHGIRPWSEGSRTGDLRHVLMRNTVQGQWLVGLVTAGKALPRAKALAADLRARHPEIATLLVNRNPHQDHRTLGAQTEVLFGTGWLEDTIGDLRFRISPESFFQVNPVQTEVLYGKALARAGLQGHETVLDLYCGIGTISLFLARQAGRVIGVETVPAAVADAEANARLNGISNAEFRVGTAESLLPQLTREGIRPEVVVVDPPRKGCDPAALKAILDLAPRRIVYVSCKPATLARDLRILTDGGYTVQTAEPVDMFPHTAHVEAVVRLGRNERTISL